jgi:hypothetical protein
MIDLQARFSNIINEEMNYAVSDVVNSINEVGIRRRTGNLLNSVRYMGEVEQGTYRIIIGAQYASYLNRGYGPFSLAEGRIGKSIPMRDSNGGLIFRKISAKPTSTGKNWMHPGYEGRQFVKKAEEVIYNRIVIRLEKFLNELDPERY